MRKLLLACVAIIALLFLVQAAMTPWFQVPVATFESGNVTIGPQEPTITPYFQWAIIAITLACVLCWVRDRQANKWMTVLASGGLLLCLFYPHAILALESPTTARAAWMQIQHENLSWYGGDVSRSQEYKHLPSQVRLFVSDSPRHVTIADLPTWSVSEIKLNRLPTLVEWMGYGNTFCQFFSRGWPLAVAGTGLLLLTSLFQRGKLAMELVQTAVSTLAIGSIMCLVCGCARPLGASHVVARAADATHRGLHESALQYLEHAAAIWPPLRQDTWFLAQRGLLEHITGRETPLARLHRAKHDDRVKRRDVAEAEYLEIATAAPYDSALRREACRGILRLGIRSLNSAEVQRAESGFRRVLGLDPCCIKALYGLQLASLRLANNVTLVSVNAQLECVYESLRFPDKHIVLAAARDMSHRALLPPGDAITARP